MDIICKLKYFFFVFEMEIYFPLICDKFSHSKRDNFSLIADLKYRKLWLLLINFCCCINSMTHKVQSKEFQFKLYVKHFTRCRCKIYKNYVYFFFHCINTSTKFTAITKKISQTYCSLSACMGTEAKIFSKVSY